MRINYTTLEFESIKYSDKDEIERKERRGVKKQKKGIRKNLDKDKKKIR